MGTRRTCKSLLVIFAFLVNSYLRCQRDTLIKYLLDELYTYEGDHCDALNPSDSHDSVARQAGNQGEVNPMCSLELRSRLEELQVQNERYQRRMEERYQTYLAQQQVQLANHINYLSESLQVLGSHLPRNSQYIPAQSSYRYHPYLPNQALTGPGVVSFFKLSHHPFTDLVV
jgi:gamma-glutamyl:cysteine ligase YbdK (ATP-grasp superfamily)